jgi:CspA family cold shock protein
MNKHGMRNRSKSEKWPEREEDAMQGTVRWFKNDKGYGFIGREDDGPDVFVHYTGILGGGYRTLQEGDNVTFEIVPARRDRKLLMSGCQQRRKRRERDEEEIVTESVRRGLGADESTDMCRME